MSNDNDNSWKVFDIETGPAAQSIIDRFTPEFEAPANFVDPVKIAKNIEERRIEWQSKAATRPTTGVILAIGVINDDGTRQIHHAGPATDFPNAFAWPDEKSLLGAFLLTIERVRYIGFNSNSFDWPFIFKRAWLHGLSNQLPAYRQAAYNRGFRGSLSVDLMEDWLMGSGELKGNGLGDVAKFLDCGEKSGKGSDFSNLYSRDPAAALAYLSNDLDLTMRVADKMGHI